MSSLEAGRIDLESRRFCIRDCVESVVELVHPAAAQKGLELAWCVDPSVPRALIGDDARVSQILLNLAANAIKFTASGEVQIEVLREADLRGRVALKVLVRDSGIGIPQSKQELLFKPFSQIDSSATRKHGGSGLGLAISRRLARLMGGDMGVESVEDAGSTFWFTLSLEAEPGAERRRPLGGVTLLALASAPFQRRAISGVVAAWGGACEFAERGADARSPFRVPASDGSDLGGSDLGGSDLGALLIDVKALGDLPRDALAAIDAEPRLASVPRILLFAHNGFDHAHELARSGLDLCLPKPLRRSTLLAALELAGTRAARNHQPAAAAKPTAAPPAASAEHHDVHEDNAMDSCSDEPLLDMGVIAMLKELGGAEEPELFEELIELFIKDSRHHLEELAEALRSSDSERLERTAHTLKSSSANIGARSLSRLCARIEQLGRACRAGEAAALVSMAGQEYAKVERALASPGA
ncbi:MAG TPA: ATP-binding protein, partial [Planctomycetota bacterium]|nr:ATP-binding protein [Planctomycetota bacterium]